MQNLSTKVLVTGGAGYIGSHAIIALLEKGYQVVVFDSLELGHIEILDILKSIRANGNFIDFVKGDLQNFEDINSVFVKRNIDFVVHFAAYSQVAESVSNPQKYYYNNVYGSLNLFKAMLENNVKNIVFSSTAATYGEPKYVPIDENHPQLPLNTYGKTKLMIENILEDYEKAYGLNSVRLRYFNVAGADNLARIGEWHTPETHLIPNVLKSALGENKAFQLYGTDYNTKDGTCIRDYINVEDLVQAHILALEYLKENTGSICFNLGTTEGNSVKEVFDICEKITNKTISKEIKPRRAGDPETLVSDNSKAQEILGWTPKHNLEDSIKSAYKWEVKLNNRVENGK